MERGEGAEQRRRVRQRLEQLLPRVDGAASQRCRGRHKQAPCGGRGRLERRMQQKHEGDEGPRQRQERDLQRGATRENRERKLALQAVRQGSFGGVEFVGWYT